MLQSPPRAAARTSVVDSERVTFQKESLKFLNAAVLNGNENAEVMSSLGLENAIQRNLDVAYQNIMFRLSVILAMAEKFLSTTLGSESGVNAIFTNGRWRGLAGFPGSLLT
ncbi:uncharacterized protein LOC131645999 isoform X2 [Vicia villosa]|uniref:uncharacterized protein LOC131645999 isoform X2 n=1 Tax=Vicia villosa TaxID=3911 RepID=UPI00273C5602|nr:uncharacterized protein LOC131645999 isoform X2 [Vicia villosa]